ncbi:MAG: MFS transporter [Clostridia bacterium]|nr:MFS transporter [Clostridia bacterium]
MEEQRFNKVEKSWITYDAANSAFTMLTTSIVPIYFASLTKNAGIDSTQSTAIYGYILTISTLIIALLAPVLGAIADYKGLKIKIFTVFLVMGLMAGVLLGIFSEWVAFTVVYIVAKVGYSGANVFYDSMLTDVTTDERMDRVSSFGYAIGYIASCVPFVLCMALILLSGKIGMDKVLATRLSFVITCAWWGFLSLPLFKNYKQNHYLEHESNRVGQSVKRLINNFKSMKEQKKIFLFILGFFFYIDAVYTIIGMAASYGTALGINSEQMLLALLLTQIIAFPFAILFGTLAKRFNTRRLIMVCILGYIFIALFAVQLDQNWEFWFLAVMVALFQGGIQALSRSYFAKIIPKERSNEYFGIFDIFGKYADLLGPFLMSVIISLTGKPNYGAASLVVLLVIGLVIMLMMPKDADQTAKE